ncbi:hypothetical protein WJX77_009228 [Trebouxia sp. C0004]
MSPGLQGRQQEADTALQLIQLGQMTDALAKWAAALDTFDSIKHNFRAPGQVEKALNSIALDERVLLFRGSDSDIVERLSPYDQVEAMGRGGLDYETLHRNLSLVRSYVDPKLVTVNLPRKAWGQVAPPSGGALQALSLARESEHDYMESLQGRLAEALIEEGPGPSKKSKTGPFSQMLLLPGRIPLCSEITRENSMCRVAMEGTTVFKQI